METIKNRGLLAIPAWEHTGSAQTQIFKIINFLSKALRFPIWESICLQNAGNHIQVTVRKELERGKKKERKRVVYFPQGGRIAVGLKNWVFTQRRSLLAAVQNVTR